MKSLLIVLVLVLIHYSFSQSEEVVGGEVGLEQTDTTLSMKALISVRETFSMLDMSFDREKSFVKLSEDTLISFDTVKGLMKDSAVVTISINEYEHSTLEIKRRTYVQTLQIYEGEFLRIEIIRVEIFMTKDDIGICARINKSFQIWGTEFFVTETYVMSNPFAGNYLPNPFDALFLDQNVIDSWGFEY